MHVSADPAANARLIYYRVQKISFINSFNNGTKEKSRNKTVLVL